QRGATVLSDLDMMFPSVFRDCERSEAIQLPSVPKMRCFASLAMTNSNDYRLHFWNCQVAIFASAASNAAAALGKSLKASPPSAVCFWASVAVGLICAIGF